MENRHSSIRHHHLSANNKTTLFVALITALAVVQVACKPVESESELVGDLPPTSTSALSADEVEGSEESTTHSGSGEHGQDKVCLRRRIIRLLLRLAIIKQVGGSSLEGDTVTDATTDIDDDGRFTTDEELAAICKELCAIGMCPPSCPGNYQPPWGGAG